MLRTDPKETDSRRAFRLRILAVVLMHLGLAVACTGQDTDRYRSQRLAMARNQLEARGVKDSQVLKAMRTVPREKFVPEQYLSEAYADNPLPIGYGQTISQPYVVGFMTQLLDVDKDQRVLEIGTGSGYQSAILSMLAGEVYSIEIVPELADSAEETLSSLGYDNVMIRAGDGYQGWPEEAPFDRIILTAAPPELPQELVDELKPGGILVAPVGTGIQNLMLVRKSKDGKTSTRSMLPVQFVPMVKGPKQPE